MDAKDSDLSNEAAALADILQWSADTLAVYALPFMIGVKAAHWAYASGAGLIGAGLVGLVAGAAAYGLLVAPFTAVRPPILRLAAALIFAAPAAVAGFALVHGIAREVVPFEVWRVIFCLIGGGVTGLSALMRGAADVAGRRD